MRVSQPKNASLEQALREQIIMRLLIGVVSATAAVGMFLMAPQRSEVSCARSAVGIRCQQVGAARAWSWRDTIEAPQCRIVAELLSSRPGSSGAKYEAFSIFCGTEGFEAITARPRTNKAVRAEFEALQEGTADRFSFTTDSKSAVDLFAIAPALLCLYMLFKAYGVWLRLKRERGRRSPSVLRGSQD